MNDSVDVVFFLGAGASAPFGIPTMKELVNNFESMLEKDGTVDEIFVFQDIKKTLEIILNRTVDLEAIFSVIDGIINYDIDRFGLLAAYSSMKGFSRIPSMEISTDVCIQLRKKFEIFIRRECMIPEKSYSEINAVYGDLFTKIYESSRSTSSLTHKSSGDISYCTTWTFITTNYDTCLEYFWRERVRVKLNTGFRYEERRRTHVLDPNLLTYENTRNTDSINLIKLHGSLNWLLEPDSTVTEQEALQSESFLGRKYIRPMMIYPIQQKELYVEPFISMFTLLNRVLMERKNWIIIGYSFNDAVIKEIFLRNSGVNKNIIYLHPHSDEILNRNLSLLKGNIVPIINYFGQHEGYQNINQEIVDFLE